MKRNQIIATSKTIKRYRDWKKDIAQGPYRPFLTVRDVNKVGRRHWMNCVKQKRQVHLLSDGERRFYTVALYKPSTISIYEQFALDVDDTLNIAVSMNLIHPRDWRTNHAHIMSTDFLVESVSKRHSSKTFLTAYTFKYWSQIYKRDDNGNVIRKSARTWQKFAIEREYWARRGIEYRVVTEQDATKVQQWNIQYCQSARNLEISDTELGLFLQHFVNFWTEKRWLPVKELLKIVADVSSRDLPRVKEVFKYSILYGFLPVAEVEHIRFFRPIELLVCEGEPL